MSMKKRVYGVIGISSIMSNWNADFTGYPKTLSSGQVFGSDKALKYTMKKQWQWEGEKVLYIKSYQLNNGSLQPRTLKEHYEKLFNVDLKEKESDQVISNLMNAIDVKNFGATFAEKDNNVSITGAVQIGQGINMYDKSEAHEQQILSPFRDSKDSESEAKNSTLGTKIISDEAHYFYSFNINPKAYDEFVEMGLTDGYTEEDYKKFKSAAIQGATAFSTNAKAGCDNEFALFVETKEHTYLPNLVEYIEFAKGEKNQIRFRGEDLLKDRDDITLIEIYYNPLTTELIDFPKNAKVYNIVTRKEL